MESVSFNQTAQSLGSQAFNYFNQTTPPPLSNTLRSADTDSTADKLSLSRQGLAYVQNDINTQSVQDNEATETRQQEASEQESQSREAGERPEPKEQTEPSSTNNSLSDKQLTQQEQQQLEDLKRRDTEVKAHEQAHLSAAGSLAKGGASFDYETGPDGKRYAVSGEVSIDTSKVSDDPQANLRKAQQIRRAATAPVDPSAQDRSVASEASRMEAQARVELSEQAREKQSEYVAENTPEADFLSQQSSRIEQSIQDTYQQIQNSSVLQEPRTFVDFFI